MPDNLLTLIETALSTLLGASITLVVTCFTTRWTEKRNEKKREIEKYEKKLKEFYNPLYFLIVKNTKLYDIFKVDERYKNKRTLHILLDDKDALSHADKCILKEIIANNHEILQLISQNAGYIEDDMMADFVELARHYVLLEQAYQGDLPDIPEYREHTYPRDINEKIKKKVETLRSEIIGATSK